jgi:6-pyruvoyltetrahydropterin/6-carboxytetrahydropterin synthase
MYYLKKTLEISGSHTLKLDYSSKCTNMHGHNWKITIECESPDLNRHGMLVDFTEIKTQIKGNLDHKHLNDVLDFNPTAENLARWICEQIEYCYKVTVKESEGNEAAYVRS